MPVLFFMVGLDGMEACHVIPAGVKRWPRLRGPCGQDARQPWAILTRLGTMSWGTVHFMVRQLQKNAGLACIQCNPSAGARSWARGHAVPSERDPPR